MEVRELAEIMNGRFNDLCKKIEDMNRENDKFRDDCRIRHTDLDKDMTKVKERQGILAVITGAISAALGGAIGLLR